MTKVTMPEPAAWLVYYLTLNGWEVYKSRKESEYMEDGAVVSIAVPLVIDAQAKSYANARVK